MYAVQQSTYIQSLRLSLIKIFKGIVIIVIVPIVDQLLYIITPLLYTFIAAPKFSFIKVSMEFCLTFDFRYNYHKHRWQDTYHIYCREQIDIFLLSSWMAQCQMYTYSFGVVQTQIVDAAYITKLQNDIVLFAHNCHYINLHSFQHSIISFYIQVVLKCYRGLLAYSDQREDAYNLVRIFMKLLTHIHTLCCSTSQKMKGRAILSFAKLLKRRVVEYLRAKCLQ